MWCDSRVSVDAEVWSRKWEAKPVNQNNVVFGASGEATRGTTETH